LLAGVRRAVIEFSRAVDDRRHADATLEQERESFDLAVAGHASAVAALEGAVAAYSEAVSGWAGTCTHLAPAGGDGGAQAFLPSPPEDPEAVADAVAELAQQARSELVVAADRLRTAVAAAERRQAELGAERAEVASGGLRHPDPPPWRSSRPDTTPGAPFWQLVDVVAGTDPAVLDGVEAALLASGVLDAWVWPDGRVELPDPSGADAVLSADSDLHGQAAGRRTLADVLHPAPVDEPAVPAPVVAGLLGAVDLRGSAAGGAGAGAPPQIGIDGTFRVGPLAGRGRVAPAAFVGAAAQEQRRLRRLAQLDEELAVLVGELAALAERLAGVQRDADALEAEVASLPGGEGIQAAERQLGVAEARVGDARSRVVHADARRRRAEEAVRAAQRDLMQRAAAAQLPTDGEALDEVERRVRSVERQAAVWSRRRRDAASCNVHLQRVEAEAARAAAELERAAAHHRTTAAEYGQLAARLAALEEGIGAEYREVAARIQQAEAGAAALGADRTAYGRRRLELAGLIGRLESELEAVEAERRASEVERDDATASFAAAVADGLAADAHLDVLPDGATPA
ncbi:MAG: hypothetical protein ACRD2W_02945, partial [Acidimicrobiales bacterium]